MIGSMTSLGGRELARRVNGQVHVRSDPLRFRARLSGLSASDPNSVDVTFSCAVGALDQPAERAMLAETFLSDRDAVTSEHVAAHFSSALRDAAARLIETQPAEHWLDDANR